MKRFDGHRRISFIHTLSMSIETAKAQGATAAEIRALVAQALKECLDDCCHLADSDESAANLSEQPCGRCGRYFIDDGSAS